MIQDALRDGRIRNRLPVSHLVQISLSSRARALLVAMLVHGGGGNAGLVKTMAESPGRVQAANLLIMFSSVFFVPGGAIVSILGQILGLHGFGVTGLKLLSMPDAGWSQGQASSATEMGVGAQPHVQSARLD